MSSRNALKQWLSRKTNCAGASVLLTPMLLVANLTNTKRCKKRKKGLQPWHMGAHLRVLSQGYPMNTNMTGSGWFSKIFASLCFGRSSIGRVNKAIQGEQNIKLSKIIGANDRQPIRLESDIGCLQEPFKKACWHHRCVSHALCNLSKNIFLRLVS